MQIKLTDTITVTLTDHGLDVLRRAGRVDLDDRATKAPTQWFLWEFMDAFGHAVSGLPLIEHNVLDIDTRTPGDIALERFAAGVVDHHMHGHVHTRIDAPDPAPLPEPRAYEFELDDGEERVRYRLVLGSLSGFECYAGRDLMGVEMWLPTDIDESNAADIAVAVARAVESASIRK